MTWNDDTWRDGYDEWKLRSPYDEYDEPCDHEDYDIDILDGRARCDRCGESWYASNEEVLAMVDHMARYAEYEEQENRRQWWRDIYYKFTAPLRPFRRWRARRSGYNDDIPF